MGNPKSISPSQRSFPKAKSAFYVVISLMLLFAAWLAWQHASSSRPFVSQVQLHQVDGTSSFPLPVSASTFSLGDELLTTSGYIINRERIELSPRFVGTVRWIAVKKGDPVKKGQVVVLLDDSEQRSRLTEAEGRFGRARASLLIAKTRFNRLKTLHGQRVESEQRLDEALAELNVAEAGLHEAQGWTLHDGNWNGRSFAHPSTVSSSKNWPTKTNWYHHKASEA